MPSPTPTVTGYLFIDFPLTLLPMQTSMLTSMPREARMLAASPPPASVLPKTVLLPRLGPGGEGWAGVG